MNNNKIKEKFLFNSHKLLQIFLNKHFANRDIFHDLMPYKVKEVLLVSSLYDAFSIESDAMISGQILGEYLHLNLTSIPRITGVSNQKEALHEISKRKFDLVIVVGRKAFSPYESISKKIKKKQPDLPIFLLINRKQSRHEQPLSFDNQSFDRIFTWNGASNVFFAMVKLLEDEKNFENDARLASVKAILLVEDDPAYYSVYLPRLYKSILEQTRRNIDDVSTDALYKVLRMRGRPKIILAGNYEEAIDFFDKHKNDLLCVISDVKFPLKNTMNAEAGFKLATKIRETAPQLPLIIQSAETKNAAKCHEFSARFFDKNAQQLFSGLNDFLSTNLGFGSFHFKNANDETILIADSLNDFEKNISKIPDESIILHSKNNDFSHWLMARGEIKAANILISIKHDGFIDAYSLKKIIAETLKYHRNESKTGRIIGFEEDQITDESNIVALSDGALGGKGRGVAFLHAIINNFNFSSVFTGLHIKTPLTFIIGTNTWETFLSENGIAFPDLCDLPFPEIQARFLEAKLPDKLNDKLFQVLKKIKTPLTVRSSSLFEDSGTHSFSGVYSTFVLANSESKTSLRLQELLKAIKLVYASIFSQKSQQYFKAVQLNIEEEKMAVVIQELAGSQYENYFYPHSSGVAQSFNYYPVSGIDPADGLVSMAAGLGHYVVNGEKSFYFCPASPKKDLIDLKQLVSNTQTSAMVLNTDSHADFIDNGEEANLEKISISVLEQHGVLKHLASVFDFHNERIIPGLNDSGPKIINFANLLKFDHLPLAKALKTMLNLLSEAMNSPVEIEFALDLNSEKPGNPSLYILQAKPYLGYISPGSEETTGLKNKKLLFSSTKFLGNGIIHDISDIIIVKPDRFDVTRTRAIAAEIAEFNATFNETGKKYILVGPGRWGTKDRFTGIPVEWQEISAAKVIMEAPQEGFSFEPSFGSHFFHNLVTMETDYISIENANNIKENLQWLCNQNSITEKKYAMHVRLDMPLTVVLNALERRCGVYF